MPVNQTIYSPMQAPVAGGNIGTIIYGSPCDDRSCLRDLYLADPSIEKARIKQTKGGLLNDSFCWILDTPEFQKWRYNKDSQLLWIKGDAGKGKTMLMIGIIEELSQLEGDSEGPKPARTLSYFLCQGTDSRLNNATAILRGMIYCLIEKQPCLISHLRKKYDYSGQKLFEGASAFYALSEIFQQMLQDPNLLRVCLAVDALDECENGLPELLDLICSTLYNPSQVKWIVSSRNRDDINQVLGFNDHHIKLSLELNANYISKAVDTYIDYKLSKLSILRTNKALQKEVKEQLHQKSDGTFLWVALVFEELQKSQLQRDVPRMLKRIPKGLPSLYKRMIQQIEQLEDDYPQLYLLLLSITCLVYCPVHMLEMRMLAGLEEEIPELEDLKRIINMSGSFITIQEEYIYLIHQSAKDYLINDAFKIVFPTGTAPIHYNIFSRSLGILSKTLRYNICNLQDFRPKSSEYKPDLCILNLLRYSCAFWYEHLCKGDSNSSNYQHKLSDNGVILKFFKTHFLHWLEALSLIHQVSDGILIIRKLLHEVQVINGGFQLIKLLKDAKRFLLSYRSIIEQEPLQAYGGALTFCPLKSEIKKYYWRERFPCIKSITGIQDNWDPCLQILEGHTNWVYMVTFSPDGQVLASASGDQTVRLWDIATGLEKQILKGHTDSVYTVAFSPDGQILASASSDQTVRLWDMATGIEKQILKGHTDSVYTIAFSPDGQILASASGDQTVRLWDITTGIEKQILKGHMDSVYTIAFSPDGQILASASNDKTVWLWDVTTGIKKQILKGHTGWIRMVAFSLDGQILASASDDKTVRLWDMATGIEKQTLKGHMRPIHMVAFSPDSQILASASDDKTVRLWNTATGIEKQMLKGHTGWVHTVAFSPDGQILASASYDLTVRLWDIATGIEKQMLKGHIGPVYMVAFSPDSQILASASGDKTVRLWDMATGVEKQMLKGHTRPICMVAFSPDGQILASVSYDKTVRLWNTATGIEKQILKGHIGWIYTVTFSPDGQILASASEDKTVRLWDTATGIEKQTLNGHMHWVYVVAFSPDGQILASASNDQTVQLWDIATGIKKQTFRSHTDSVYTVAFSPDGQILASASDDQTIRLWDITTGIEKKTLKGHMGWVRMVAFSPDGQILASASHDQTARLWDMATGIEKQTLKGHMSSVHTVAFSPDGQILASASYDQTVRLWDTATGVEKQMLKHSTALTSLLFSRDIMYLNTDRGMLPLNSDTSNMLNHEENKPHAIFVDKEWVTFDGQKLLWLPLDYRAKCAAIYNKKLVLGHSSGLVTFLEFL